MLQLLSGNLRRSAGLALLIQPCWLISGGFAFSGVFLLLIKSLPTHPGSKQPFNCTAWLQIPFSAQFAGDLIELAKLLP